MKQITVDKLTVKMMETRKEMGEVAATDICNKIKELLEKEFKDDPENVPKVNKEEYIPLQEELVRYMEDEEWL